MTSTVRGASSGATAGGAQAFPIDAGSPLALTPVDKVEAHVRSEHGNSIQEIMDTVSSWDVHFALISPTDEGLSFEFAGDRATAEQNYIAKRRGTLMTSSVHLKDVAGSWYVVVESVGHLEHTGDIGGVAATGRTLHVPVVVLFPVWTDGIIGEIGAFQFDLRTLALDAAERQPSPEVDARYLPGAQVRNARLHAEFLRRWMARDAAIGELFDETFLSVVRVAAVDSDRRATIRIDRREDFLGAITGSSFGTVRSHRVVNFYVADWYVFAEYLLHVELDQGTTVRRMAAVYPVTTDGRIVGQLAYALDFDHSQEIAPGPVR
jgi:hypothetical protein